METEANVRQTITSSSSEQNMESVINRVHEQLKKAIIAGKLFNLKLVDSLFFKLLTRMHYAAICHS